MTTGLKRGESFHAIVGGESRELFVESQTELYLTARYELEPGATCTPAEWQAGTVEVVFNKVNGWPYQYVSAAPVTPAGTGAISR